MRITYILFTCLCLLSLIACEKEEAEPSPRRTVLIYIAGDNNLSSNAYTNIQWIEEGLEKDGLDNGNLLVYIDTRSESPRLFRITVENGVALQTDVEVFEEDAHSSASPETLTYILDKVIREYPADGYGLVLWSHGTAWLPSDTRSYLRSFGQDGNDFIELNELASALSPFHFDFLLFDACYMASTEVFYALRERADYLIGSPTEILGNGFPYSSFMGKMFADEVDAVGIATEFYNYYKNSAGTVSVIKSDELDALAETCREIFQTKTEEELFAVPVSELQIMEHLTSQYHALYDLDDYISRLATAGQYEAFRQALDKAVIYKANTLRSYYANGGYIAIDRFSGLSIYVPQAELPKLNEWYEDLEWYRYVYP